MSKSVQIKPHHRRKVTQTHVEQMQKLFANGVTIRQLASIFPYSVGTIHNYTKDVIRLPLELQENPFKRFKKGRSVFDSIETLKDKQTAITQKELADDVYWKENHIPGQRYGGPLDRVALSELQEIMAEPTGYHSPLARADWYNYYLADQMLGVGNVLSQTQIRISQFLKAHPKGMIQVFRGAGKTVFVVGGLVYEIVEFRDGNYFVQSETIGMSRKRVQSVRTVLMSNKPLIADYGFLPHYRTHEGVKQTWKAGEFVVKRDIVQIDPTLIALSWKQAETLGSHFRGGIFDDPWSLKLQRAAPVSVEHWLEWYDTTFIPTMDSAEFEYFLCTRKGLDDIYSNLEERGMHHLYKQPAILQFPSKYRLIRDEQGVIVGVEVLSDDWEISDDCNGRFSIEKFLLIREAMKSQVDTSFEQEYQLNPLPPAGLAFDWKQLQWFNGEQEFYNLITADNEDSTEKMRNRYMQIIGSMDLAFGKSKRADFTALCVIGYIKPNFYLLQIYLDRGGDLAKKAQMIRLAKQQFPRLKAVYVEADLQQSATVNELKGLVTEVPVLPVLSRQQETPLRQYKTDEFSSKDIRIMNQLDIPLAAHNIWINKRANHLDEFEREYRYFPRSAHKDVLDAFGNGISKFSTTKAVLYGYSGV